MSNMYNMYNMYNMSNMYNISNMYNMYNIPPTALMSHLNVSISIRHLASVEVSAVIVIVNSVLELRQAFNNFASEFKTICRINF